MGRSVPRKIGWLGLTALVAAAGCQAILGLEEGKPLPAGTGGEPTTTTTTTTTTSGGGEGGMAGGGGGQGGQGGMGGQGGQGGSGGGGSTCTDGSQNGDEAGVDCGGSSCAPCPVLLLLGGGGPTVVGGAYHPTSGWSTSTVMGGSAVSRPALAWSAANEAVGLVRSAGDILLFTAWHQPNTWSGLAMLPNAASTSRSEPALSAAPAGAIGIYQEPTLYMHYHAAFAAGAWSLTEETSGSPGPTAADVTAEGGDVVMAFVQDSTNDVCVRRRMGAAWQVAQCIATDSDAGSQVRIVTLAGGQGMLVAYVIGTQIRAARWDGMAWSTPISVANALTNARPALAPTAGGGAFLGYRGTNNKLYGVLYDGAAWDAPVEIPGPAADVVAPPAVAPGVGDAELELVYVVTGGTAYHTRRRNNVWEAPIMVDTVSGLTHVTLASPPP